MIEDRRKEIMRLAERVPVLAREAFEYCNEQSRTLDVRWFVVETLWRIGQRLRLRRAVRRQSPLSRLCDSISTIAMLSRCIVVMASSGDGGDEEEVAALLDEALALLNEAADRLENGDNGNDAD